MTKFDDWLTREPEPADDDESLLVCPNCKRTDLVQVRREEEVQSTYESHEECQTCGGRWFIPNLDEPMCERCHGEGFLFMGGSEDPQVCLVCDGCGRPSLKCPEPPKMIVAMEATKYVCYCVGCDEGFEVVVL